MIRTLKLGQWLIGQREAAKKNEEYFMKIIFIVILLFSAVANVVQAQEEEEEKEYSVSVMDDAKVVVMGNIMKFSTLFGELGNISASQLKFRKGMTLTQSIEESGGLRWNKKKLNVYVYRIKPQSWDRYVIKFELDKVRNGKSENVILQPYDIVQVQCPKKKSCPGFENHGLYMIHGRRKS